MENQNSEKGCIVMTRQQVRDFDRWAIEELAVPGVVLMENAGRGCAEVVAEKLGSVAGSRVCIFCGTGNNGGDGYVIARHLLNSQASVVVVIVGEAARVSGDAKVNLNIWESMGGAVVELDRGADISEQVRLAAEGADVVVDALFGTGLSGEVRADYRELIEAINGLEATVAAVDIPSGLDCDTGRALGIAIRATYTVTFVAIKQGFTQPGSAEFTGEVYVASIGVEPGSRDFGQGGS